MKKNKIVNITLGILVFLAGLPSPAFGAGSDILQITVSVDGTPPVTTDDYDNKWHNADFTITLDAADSQSSVKDTYYKLNSGADQTVAADGHPVISVEGDNNTLEYWSVDLYSNTESHNTLTGIKLDKTDPLVNISSPTDEEAFGASPIDITGTVSDALSGIKKLDIDVDGTIYNPVVEADGSFSVADVPIAGGPNSIKAIAEDNAVNEAQDSVTAFLGWVLHLDIPYSSVGAYYSGAASAHMILSFIRDNVAPGALGQDEVYDYGHPNNYPANSTLDEMDARAVDYALGHFDPYDQSDPTGQGDAYKAYNFAIRTFETDKFTEYLRDVIHWMAFPVTIDPWWISTVLTEHPNTPPAVPAYGSYGHWIVVNGAATSENPAPEPHVNPWYTPDFTVYGLWLTDPASGGIGQDLYVTAQSAQDTYLLPLVSSDQHNGYYLQVAEPPEETSDGQVDMAEPVVNEETIKVIEIAREMAKEEEAQLSSFEKRINSAKRHIYDAALVVNLENDANNCKENALLANSADDLLASVFKFGEKPPIELNWKDVVDPSLLTDEDFRGAFDGSQAREFVKVRRADMADSYYYLIPFDKYVDGRFLTYAAVIVDAADGSFKEASWVEEPTRFIQVNKDEAIRLAESLDPLMHGAAIESELIWEPGSVSQSPFYPYWLLTSGDSAYYVTQEGGVISK